MIIMDEIRERVRPVEQKYKGGFIYFSEVVEKNLKEVVLDLYGYEYDILKELAVSIATRIGVIEGFEDIRMSRISGRPEWGIAVDKNNAALYDLTTKDIADTLHSEIRGLRATLYHTESRELETVSRLREEDRKRLDDLRKLVLFSKEGHPIMLEQVADFIPQIGSAEIVRKNKTRVIHITALATTGSLLDAVGKVKANLADMEFPKDYYYRIGGNFERKLKNDKELTQSPISFEPPYFHMPGILWITIFLVYLVLASLFESYIQPVIIMISVPLSAIGIILGLRITNKPISMGVIIGGIMLAGIVVNNAIVLVDRVNFLRKRHEMALLKALLAAGQDRLRPIAMTTSTTILGLMPMAFDKSESSNLWSPLAVTVISGMASSTILTLFLVPSIYLIFEDLRVLFIKPKELFMLVKGKMYGIINIIKGKKATRSH